MKIPARSFLLVVSFALLLSPLRGQGPTWDHLQAETLTFDGKVTKISPMGVEKDNVTTFEVRVSIQNPGGELKAEMTANAEIILEEHKNVLQIPEGAILYDKDKKASVEISCRSLIL